MHCLFSSFFFSIFNFLYFSPCFFFLFIFFILLHVSSFFHFCSVFIMFLHVSLCLFIFHFCSVFIMFLHVSSFSSFFQRRRGARTERASSGAASRRRVAPPDQRLEVLLHETLLNPAQPTMSSSMIGSAPYAAEPVHGKNQKDLHGDANRRLSPPSPALKKFRSWRTMAEEIVEDFIKKNYNNHGKQRQTTANPGNRRGILCAKPKN